MSKADKCYGQPQWSHLGAVLVHYRIVLRDGTSTSRHFVSNATCLSLRPSVCLVTSRFFFYQKLQTTRRRSPGSLVFRRQRSYEIEIALR